MPIYEFQCESCSTAFELFLMSKKEMDKVRCTKCSSPEIKKMISASNISTSPANMSQSAISGASSGDVQHRQCSSGSCSTFNLPGHSK